MRKKQIWLGDESLAQRFHHRLRFGMHLELFVDMTHVEGDGVRGNAEFHRRGFEVVTLNEELP